MTCPGCGKTNVAGARFCTGCGARLPAPAESAGPGRGVPAPPPAPEIAPEPDNPEPPVADEAPAEAAPPRAHDNARAIKITLLVAVAALVGLAAHFFLGVGASVHRVSGSYNRAGSGFSLELPPKGWYAPARPEGGVDELAVFFRGRGPRAPVVLTIHRGKSPAPMPAQIVEYHAVFMKDYFVKRAEKLLVGGDLGLEGAETAALDGMGVRSGLLLSGQAVPANGDPYPVRIVFVYAEHDEYAMVFRLQGGEPGKHEKEILKIARSFRIVK
jgi:hypothetical protein